MSHPVLLGAEALAMKITRHRPDRFLVGLGILMVLTATPERASAQTAQATIVMDPHNPQSQSDDPKTGGQATIYITAGESFTGAVFNITNSQFLFGCDLSAVESKFLHVKLDAWIPSKLVKSLFKDIGITVRGSQIARIASVTSKLCVDDPKHMQGTNPGFLVMDTQLEIVPK